MPTFLSSVIRFLCVTMWELAVRVVVSKSETKAVALVSANYAAMLLSANSWAMQSAVRKNALRGSCSL